MFIDLTAISNGTRRTVSIVVANIFGISYSDTAKATLVLSTTGHAIPVEESVDKVHQLMLESINNNNNNQKAITPKV